MIACVEGVRHADSIRCFCKIDTRTIIEDGLPMRQPNRLPLTRQARCRNCPCPDCPCGNLLECFAPLVASLAREVFSHLHREGFGGQLGGTSVIRLEEGVHLSKGSKLALHV